MQNLLALGFPMGAEWIVIAALGLLIFGKRLPEVGRSLGKGIVEFKKGIKGVEDDIEQVDVETPASRRIPDQSTVSADHKFDPFTGKPLKPQFKFDPYTGKPVEEEIVAEHTDPTPPSA
jgi:sec-independent protein translocase protein TatA